jgi:hypothetical protein
MAQQVLEGMQVSVGTRASDATVGFVGTADATPFVSWTLPPNIIQQRFRVIVEHDTFTFARTQTTIRQSIDHEVRLPVESQLTDVFRGLCRLRVEISTNLTGEMEFVSHTTYFVYDPNLERLHNADMLSIAWQGLTDDGPGAVSYHIQLGTNPLFTDDVLYEVDNIPHTGAVIQHDIDPVAFVPLLDTHYFYRVRAFDGLDFGSWSEVNAFVNRSYVAPVLTIDDVEEHVNLDRDVDITFTINGEADEEYSVQFSYFGTDKRYPDQWFDDTCPLYLLDPVVVVKSGTHTVTWRSLPQLGLLRVQLVLSAKAVNEAGREFTDQTEPIVIDNTSTPDDGGGIPFETLNFPVRLGWLRMPVGLSDYADNLPIFGTLADAQSSISEFQPIKMGPYAWHNSYIFGTVEYRMALGQPGAHAWFGYGHEKMHWPIPIAYDNVPQGKTWQNLTAKFGGESLEANRAVAVTMDDGFLFEAPRDDTQTDTLPKPVGSRDLKRYLWGYLDLSNVEQPYPDGYDWNKRPNWHRGREVYRTGDAWVQIAEWKIQDHDVCDTCNGRGWVPSLSGPPYDRNPCPNTNCVEGFDKTQLLIRTLGGLEPNYWVVTRPWVDVKWERLSKWLWGQPYNELVKFGTTVQSNSFAQQYVHVLGRQPTSIEAQKDGQGQVTGYEFDVNGQTVWLPPEVPFWDWSDVPNIAPTVTRQPDDTGLCKVWLNPREETVAGGQVLTFPMPGFFSGHDTFEDVQPVDGSIAEDRKQFYLGQSDPDSHPHHWKRPRPTQPGSLMISPILGEKQFLIGTRFRFLDITPQWDSFITIHFQYSPSPLYQVQIQYRTAGSTNEADWTELQATNGVYNAARDAWLIPPFTYHAYWSTADPIEFPEGRQVRLRMKVVNETGQDITAWSESQIVTVRHGVSNPVNMLSMVYEPWEHAVHITFRIDDTQFDAYTLTRFWYAIDREDEGIPLEWHQIANGDIVGEVSYLSARTGENEHKIKWMAASYNIPPNHKTRIKVECIPTGMIEHVTLPILKWLTPRNPYIDSAESELADMLGHTIRQRFNETTQEWEGLDPPLRLPGELQLLQQELDDVKLHPLDADWYSFHTETPVGSGNWVLSDPAGLNAWYDEDYTSTETHGQAMKRLYGLIDQITRIRVPEAQEQVVLGERRIRKRLIDQGYYAEGNFKTGPLREVVDVVPTMNRSGDPLPTTVERHWRFRVQNVADGGTNVFQNGVYDPAEITPLEQVWYKVDLDRTLTFDSQQYSRPLRRFVTSHLGSKISVASFYGGADKRPRNFTQEDVQDDAGRPWEDQPSDRDDQTPEADATGGTPQGGVLKLLPEVLPGEITAEDMDEPDEYPPQIQPEQKPDVFAGGQTEWNGNYYWRVAAYNAFTAPIEARPRPRVDTLTISQGLLYIEYLSQAHEDIKAISLRQTLFSGYDGYQISTTTKTPTWESIILDDATGPSKVDWVSDTRAASTEETRQMNGVWIPAGKDRPHPCVWYDEDLQQYALFHSKEGYHDKWRVMGGRSMNLPKACEYDVYFHDEPDHMVYAPCVIKTSSGYRMYMTVKATAVALEYVAYSDSTDLDNWGALIPVEGLTIAKHACIVIDGGTWHMWYQKLFSGKEAIFYATSTDGHTWVQQNSGNPVYTDFESVGKPSVIRLNSQWAMYFNEIESGNIASVVSANGINWSSYRVEMTPQVINSEICIAQNPSVFVDRYYGNDELFMAFNFMRPGGEHMTYVALQESRTWTPGVAGGIFGESANITEVPCTREGIQRYINCGADLNGVSTTTGLKVRLIFTGFGSNPGYTPTTKEYHRQSDWVDVQNAIETESTLTPNPYLYDQQLLALDYMKVYGDVAV